jgi:hypothetical protein
MNIIHAEKEALINELKGNLFEYLLGLYLSKIHKIEANFHNGFTGSIKEKLIKYEAHLLKNDPYLFKKLPSMALEVANKINEILPSRLDNIFVVGMSGFRFDLKEADLILVSGEKKIFLSVKLCKANSFVNTKSAGVRSFIKTYFSQYKESPKWQNDLNVVVDLSFEKMAKKMHQIAGIAYTGGFFSSWFEKGYADLPGRLPPQMKEILRNFYFEVNSKIHNIFMDMERISPEQLTNCLLPLIGFGDSNIIRVTYYHKEVLKEKYSLEKITIGHPDKLKQTKVEALKPGLSSFEINFPGGILQIRVKPMNVFTTPAVKINCSTKDVN